VLDTSGVDLAVVNVLPLAREGGERVAVVLKEVEGDVCVVKGVVVVQTP
jgi:hypothetical protein